MHSPPLDPIVLRLVSNVEASTVGIKLATGVPKSGMGGVATESELPAPVMASTPSLATGVTGPDDSA